MAISGAAVAPGLGSNTTSGIASLLTLSGLRLGYWWNSLGMSRDADSHSPRHVNKSPNCCKSCEGVSREPTAQSGSSVMVSNLKTRQHTHCFARNAGWLLWLTGLWR